MATNLTNSIAIHSLSAVRKGLIDVNEKLDSINKRVNIINEGLSLVPDRMMNMEESITSKAQKMAELEERNKLHSAKLKLLQKEVHYEKMRGELLMDYLKTKGPMQRDTGYNAIGGQSDRGVGFDTTRTGYQDNMGAYMTDPAPQAHNAGTGVRSRQQTPYNAASNNNQPDDASRQNDDVRYNKYDVTNSQTKKPVADLEEIQKKRRKEIYSIYDSTAINPQFYEETKSHKKYPWFDHETHPYPGGFMFMRFDDSGYDSVNVALKSQQSICRNAGGYLMGIARKQRIFVFELGNTTKQQNWVISRNQPYDDVITTENAVASFWFTKKEAAENFYENCHHNRFRDPCFPTPRGFEAYYVPLQVSPTSRQYNTFLFIEVLLTPAKRDALHENMTQFEAEIRNDMSRVVPGCQPMIVSSSTGRVIFKPGLFVSPYSKLYISRFESQRDVDKIWKLGMIQGLRQKWGLTVEMNVYSMTIDDAF